MSDTQATASPATESNTQPQGPAVAAAGGKPKLSFSEGVALWSQNQQTEREKRQASDAARVLSEKAKAAKAAKAAEPKDQPAETEADPVATQAEAEEGQPAENLEGPDGVEAEADESGGEGEAVDGEPGDDPIIEIKGVKVPRSEIEKHYERQSIWSRKMNDLSEKTKAFESRETEYTAKRTSHLSQLEHVLGLVAQEFAAEPDWAKIKAEDPVNYPDRFQAHQEKLAKFEAARKYQAEETAKATTANVERTVEQLMTRTTFADWVDPGKRKTGIGEISVFLKQHGQDPVLAFQDPTLVELAYDAMRFRKMMATKGKALEAVKDKPKVQAPGAKKPAVTQAQGKVQKAWEAFVKNPTTENGAAYQRAKREAQTR